MQDSHQLPDSETATVLQRLVTDYLREQKSARRWRTAWRVLWIGALITFFWYAALRDEEQGATKPHVGLIDVEGEIFNSSKASADNLAKGLDDAYRKGGLKAIILRINSPGGSAVEADYMFNSIRYYRKLHKDIKIYAVCVDMCASAAYYLAAAADEIYAAPASMVGSIGVVYNGFGFVDLMQKLGISRRLQTAGKYKGFLDPFSPAQPAEQSFLQTMLDEVHQQFISKVKEGRGSRILIDNDTFSGLLWAGEQARVRGLIDGFASSGELARKLVPEGTVVDYTVTETVFDRFSKSMGTSMARGVLHALGMRQGLA